MGQRGNRCRPEKEQIFFPRNGHLFLFLLVHQSPPLALVDVPRFIEQQGPCIGRIEDCRGFCPLPSPACMGTGSAGPAGSFPPRTSRQRQYRRSPSGCRCFLSHHRLRDWTIRRKPRDDSVEIADNEFGVDYLSLSPENSVSNGGDEGPRSFEGHILRRHKVKIRC